MLNNYFQHQHDILKTECDFQCPDDCDAPGCRKADIIVEVTLFDLIKLSRFLNISVSHLFSQHCHLGLKIYKDNIHYMRLLIKMKKPCLFLSGNRCDVHDAKPLTCRLFPELYQIQGVLSELSKKPLFHSFPCLKKPIVVSEMRKQALKKINRMNLWEKDLSYLYLFGVPSFIIDNKNLRKKFRQSHPKHRGPSLRDYDHFLNNLLKSCRFTQNVKEKIARLDSESEIKYLFDKLSDRDMMEHLTEKCVRPTVVHRLEENNIKQLKRSPQPPATYFM